MKYSRKYCNERHKEDAWNSNDTFPPFPLVARKGNFRRFNALLQLRELIDQLEETLRQFAKPENSSRAQESVVRGGR